MNDLFVSGIRLKNGLPEGNYFAKIPALRGMEASGGIEFHTPVTFFAGENGTGKSTILEALAVKCKFNPEGGTRNFNFSTAETHSELYKNIIVSKNGLPLDGFFFRAESFYNVSSEIDRLDKIPAGQPLISASYGGKSLHEQSHGESFMSLMNHRFGGNGLYILDEPEAALSPNRQMSLLTIIHKLVKKGSQFIIATHSPIIMAYPGAEIYLLNESGIELTQYSETEHYSITKYFLNNTDKMLKLLLEEETE